MSNSTNLQLPYIDPNQNQKSVTHNDALTALDALISLAIQSAILTAPPASPADGQRWLVAASPTGAWAGEPGKLAAWQDGAWAFYAPPVGTLALNVATGGLILNTGTAWVTLASLLAQLGVSALGIGTAPDTGNPLSATLNAALFNAATASGGTGDVRVKLNKAATANTASFLFQDGFSGRAEIGLTGDDNFHFKVSPDGATFYDALVITAAGGAAKTPFGLTTPQINGGPLAGFRNRLMNGGFLIDQRAYATGSALAAGAYGFDRWKAGASGATLTFTAAKPDTSVTIAAGTLVQVIEDVNVEGGSYILSWSGTASARIYQGSATGSYAPSPVAVTGLTAGAAVTVEFSTGTVVRPQVEPGAVATPFERRPLGLELALCQRYYQRITFIPNGTLLDQYCGGAQNLIFSYAIPPMRAVPTIGVSDISFNNGSAISVYATNTWIEVSGAAQSAGRFYASGAANPYFEMNAEL